MEEEENDERKKKKKTGVGERRGECGMRKQGSGVCVCVRCVWCKCASCVK